MAIFVGIMRRLATLCEFEIFDFLVLCVLTQHHIGKKNSKKTFLRHVFLSNAEDNLYFSGLRKASSGQWSQARHLKPLKSLGGGSWTTKSLLW